MSISVVVFVSALYWVQEYLYARTGVHELWPGLGPTIWQQTSEAMKWFPRVESYPSWRNLVLPLITYQILCFPWMVVGFVSILMMARAFAPFVAEREASQG
jgi:hypothetical protein